MSNPELILYLEDNPRDAELLRDKLQQLTMPHELRIATGRAQYEAALAQTRFDLIISDYALPDYDGFAALTLALEKQPDVPFILISGTLSEEQAVNCLHRGATDYVIKQNLKRLVPAVLRALTEAGEHQKRRAAEEALRTAEQRYRDLFNQANEGLLIMTLDGQVIEINRIFAEEHGYTVTELERSNIQDLDVRKEQAMDSRADLLRRMQVGEVLRFEAEHFHKDGHIIPFAVTSRMITLDGQSFYLASHQDITTLKQAEATRMDEAERRRVLFEECRDGIVVMDREGKVCDANRRYAEMLGYSPDEVLRLHVWDWDKQWTQEQLLDMIRSIDRDGAFIETRHLRKDGSQYDVEVSSNSVIIGGQTFIFCVCRDVTARNQAIKERALMQAQLIQSQKLESIGTLAAGVAHEINNPIMGVMGYAQLILDKLGPDSPGVDYATEIGKEAERIAIIVKNLLSFARLDAQNRSPARLCDIVEATLSLIRAVLRHEDVTLEVDMPPDLPEIRCSTQQIQQVIMNLMTNARDALNEKYPQHDANKIITISAREVTGGGGQGLETASFRPRWLRLTVEDHGTGIPADLCARIFEPFFTTKPREKGTGLGLSITYGIIKDHGGLLSVESEVGQWTRFHVELPAAPELSEVNKKGDPEAL